MEARSLSRPTRLVQEDVAGEIDPVPAGVGELPVLGEIKVLSEVQLLPEGLSKFNAI